MKITIERTFGKIEVDSADAKELIREMSFWQTLPDICPLCGTELILFYRNPKDNSYYGLVCKGKVKHETNFGQHKVGDGLYYKNEWKEAFSSYQDERDAEINKHSQPNATEYSERIENAKKAIRELGGKIDSPSHNESEKQYFDSLVAQYNRLKK